MDPIEEWLIKYYELKMKMNIPCQELWQADTRLFINISLFWRKSLDLNPFGQKNPFDFLLQISKRTPFSQVTPHGDMKFKIINGVVGLCDHNDVFRLVPRFDWVEFRYKSWNTMLERAPRHLGHKHGMGKSKPWDPSPLTYPSFG